MEHFTQNFGMVGPVGLPSFCQALLAQRHRPSKLRYHPSKHRHHPRRYAEGGKNHVEYSSSPESQRSCMCSFTTNLAESEDALQLQTWFTKWFTIDHHSPYLTMMCIILLTAALICFAGCFARWFGWIVQL